MERTGKETMYASILQLQMTADNSTCLLAHRNFKCVPLEKHIKSPEAYFTGTPREVESEEDRQTHEDGKLLAMLRTQDRNQNFE